MLIKRIANICVNTGIHVCFQRKYIKLPIADRKKAYHILVSANVRIGGRSINCQYKMIKASKMIVPEKLLICKILFFRIKKKIRNPNSQTIIEVIPYISKL